MYNQKKRIQMNLLKNRSINRVMDIGNKPMVTSGKDKLGDWDRHINTTIYKIGNY